MRVELSEEVMEAVRRLAEEQGRSEGEVLEDAVRYFLGSYAYFARISERRDVDVEAMLSWGSSLEELFERVAAWQLERGVNPLSEDEAMRLAVEEQRAWRREN